MARIREKWGPAWLKTLLAKPRRVEFKCWYAKGKKLSQGSFGKVYWARKLEQLGNTQTSDAASGIEHASASPYPMVCSMLDVSPESRPTRGEVLENAWFQPIRPRGVQEEREVPLAKSKEREVPLARPIDLGGYTQE